MERAAEGYPNRVAIVHGDRRTSYRDFASEATRLAHALQVSGIDPLFKEFAGVDAFPLCLATKGPTALSSS